MSKLHYLYRQGGITVKMDSVQNNSSMIWQQSQDKKDSNGNKNYIGNLDEVTDGILKLDVDGIVDIDRKNISQVKTVYID